MNILVVANARIERCAYPVLNGDESSIFCVSNQVALPLATTFLYDHLPEPACRPPTTTSFCKTYLNSHETLNTEDTDESHSLDET
jgi:hypothetical protein